MRKHYLTISIILFALSGILIAIWLTCGGFVHKNIIIYDDAASESELRNAGTTLLDRAFDTFPQPAESKVLYEHEIRYRLHVVTDYTQFDWMYAKNLDHGIVGYVSRTGTMEHVWILGRELPNGQIYIHQFVNGHEVNHVYNRIDGVIVNPDKIDEILNAEALK